MYYFNGNAIVDANGILLPELVAEANRGIDGWNVATKARVPAKWYSKLYKLASPQYKAVLHRLLLDYSFQIDGAVDDANNGWYVKVVAGDGTVLIPEYQVPAQGDPSAYLYRRRHSKDAFTEAVDCQIQIQWKDSGGTYPAVIKAELYESVIEFQRTRLRTSS
jgi:hypothetical protein